MPLTRRDVLDTARRLVADYGLGDLTMRRLAFELGVKPGAIYWHVPSKQALLAELADELLDSVPEPSPRKRWDRQLLQLGTDLRAALRSHTDAAELVAAGRATSLASSQLGKSVMAIVQRSGAGERQASAARDALLHFVIGFTFDEQSHESLVRHGASPARLGDSDRTFDDALAVVVRGIVASARPSTS